MIYQYEASAPLVGREKVGFELVATQGANPVDRVLERGVAIDFTNDESNALSETLGQLKTKRTHFFHDPKQVDFK